MFVNRNGHYLPLQRHQKKAHYATTESPSIRTEFTIHPHRMHLPSASNQSSIRNENIIVSTPSFP